MSEEDRIASALKSVSSPLRIFALRSVASGARAATDVHALWLQHDETVSLSNVSYHLRKLREAGMIEVVTERHVRGAIQKDYALTKLGRDMLVVVEGLS